MADVIFDTEISTNHVIDIFKDAHKGDIKQKAKIRQELFDALREKYTKLKSYNLRQLHFHLPNNDSFLRMHRPNKFGDNLTDVRATVKYVNENQEYIHGFEEGRIFNGFRFVYPLFTKENEHIGSVEISFSALALIQTIEKTYNLESNFIVRKDVVDEKVFDEEKSNYLKSPHREFYFERKIYEYRKGNIINVNGMDLTDKILKGQPFTVYLDEYKVSKTFIPIRNPITQKIVAALCICEKDNFINNAETNLVIISIFTSALITLLLYLFYTQRLANQKLESLNKNLDKQVKIEIKKNRKKDLQILNQAKMVSFGEILNNISHQWRQPLNAISTSASGLMLHKEVNSLDDKTFKLLTNSIVEHTQNLSSTIESFKDYVDTENKTQLFVIQDVVEKVLQMVNSSFSYHHIEINKKFTKEPIHTSAVISDVSQVLLNIINNAKDALLKNNAIDNREITIDIHKKDKETIRISILDNAGGVPEEITEKIFEPYFTTKHESMGTGIGLYMCYEVITQKLHGKLYVRNTQKGAKFIIEIPIKK